MIVHTVFFWIRKDAPASARKQLIDDCPKYLKSPTVNHLWVGTPADTPERDVVNATFDVGLTVIFDDVAAHNAYQVHPQHNIFIERNKSNFLRIEVFNVNVQ
jgi:hypothetical protein